MNAAMMLRLQMALAVKSLRAAQRAPGPQARDVKARRGSAG